jgi:isoleucyl-tRNA synthetase
VVDLSAFYLDIRKDVLYCSPAASPERRAARTVLDKLTDCLITWLAPVLCFTAEEAWLIRNPGSGGSVHLQQFPEIPAEWRNDSLNEKWSVIREVRRVVTGALEVERREKRIGSSLQAHVKVFVSADQMAAFAGVAVEDIFITSSAELVEGPAPEGAFTLDDVSGVGALPTLADGNKCERCWKVLPDVGETEDDNICGRCKEAVAAHIPEDPAP